jgi:hypothetical protein
MPRKSKAEPALPAWYEDPDTVAAAVRPFRDAWLGRCVHVPHDPDNPVSAGDCVACLNALIVNGFGAFNKVALAHEAASVSWSAPGADPRRSR